MRIFINFLILSFMTFNVCGWAADVDDSLVTPIITDHEIHWRDMHNHAQSRYQSLKEKIALLADKDIPLHERYTIACKLRPDIDESKISISSTLKPANRKNLLHKKVINIAISDLLYDSIYWDFLERNITYYCQEPQNTIEIRRAFLVNFAKELVHTNSYTLGAIEDNGQCKYNLEEFFLNRAIHEECEAIAALYGFEIPKMPLILDQRTQQPVAATELASENLTFHFNTDRKETSSDELYFMEQLVFHRKRFDQQTQTGGTIPNLESPQLKAFQGYILPSSGPILIKELKDMNIVINNSAESKKSISTIIASPQMTTKDTRPSKPKLTSPTTYHTKATQVEPVSKIEPESYESASSDNEQTETKIEAERKEATKLLVDVIKSKLPVLEVNTSSAPLPIVVFKPTARTVLNLRDIRLHVEHRYTTSYRYLDNEFPLPFFMTSNDRFDMKFLKTLKTMTHLSPSTDKLPNIAEAFLTFHYQLQGKQLSHTINFNEIFLSGGKYFDKSDMMFKQKHHIVNGMQDILTEQEHDSIRRLPPQQTGIPLGIAMEKKLRRFILEGPWKSNCLDSEAIFLLTLYKKLPTILKKLAMLGEGNSICLNGAILGISSFRDCCHNCQRLIHGFQCQFKNIIESLNIAHLTVHDAFGTLAITSGHIRHIGKYQIPAPKFVQGMAQLEPKKHKLICTQDNIKDDLL
jgi:hypothetical protein